MLHIYKSLTQHFITIVDLSSECVQSIFNIWNIYPFSNTAMHIFRIRRCIWFTSTLLNKMGWIVGIPGDMTFRMYVAIVDDNRHILCKCYESICKIDSKRLTWIEQNDRIIFPHSTFSVHLDGANHHNYTQNTCSSSSIGRKQWSIALFGDGFIAVKACTPTTRHGPWLRDSTMYS